MNSRNGNDAHNHNHHALSGRRALTIALIVVLVIMVAEVIGGLLSNSLALLGDAGHMLVDALALALSLFAIIIARRPTTPSKTYGYHRVEILAALVNGVTLGLLSLYIFYEAYTRLLAPQPVNVLLMLPIASIGLVANLTGVLLLRRTNRANLNVRAAFLHVIGDAMTSVGVIVAGLIIAFTGQTLADPIIALVIGAVILWGAIRLVRESTNILLEAVPKHLATDRVVAAIKTVSGVDDVHDVHIWTISSGIHALSAHLLIGDQALSESSRIVEAVNQHLNQQFNIAHTTLQLECDKCPSSITCEIDRCRIDQEVDQEVSH